MLGSTDDPDHARHRRVLRSAFLPTAIARLEPRVAAIADELFDAIVPQGEGDFVELYAFPFPAIVIGELLGVRPEDREHFRRWSTAAVDALTGGDVAAYEEAKKAISDCIEVEVEARLGAEHVGDDVSSLLAIGVPRRGDLAGRDAPPRLPAPRRRPRDHDEPDRADAVPPHHTPRRDGATARRPGARAACRRGGIAVRLPGPRAVPDERLGVHGRRSDARAADEDAAPVRLGQQGSGTVGGPRRVPPRPGRQRAAPARRLRLGDPLLHRRPAGPPGGTAHVRAHPRPDGRHRAGGSPASQRVVRAPRV